MVTVLRAVNKVRGVFERERSVVSNIKPTLRDATDHVTIDQRFAGIVQDEDSIR